MDLNERRHARGVLVEVTQDRTTGRSRFVRESELGTPLLHDLLQRIRAAYQSQGQGELPRHFCLAQWRHLHRVADEQAHKLACEIVATARRWGLMVIAVEHLSSLAPARWRRGRRNQHPGATDMEAAFRAAAAAGATGLVVTSAAFSEATPSLVSLATANHVASIAAFREWTAGGGLMFYGPNLDELTRHAATFVDKILKGAKPGDLPIEEPTKYDFIINLKTAKPLGLTVPPEVLSQATEVIP